MERQGKGMDLFHSGMSIVMTDVEGSTGLWEWNSRIMNSALALHDHTLRSLLPKYFGYEVSGLQPICCVSVFPAAYKLDFGQVVGDFSPFAASLSCLPCTGLTLDKMLSPSVEASQSVFEQKRKEKAVFE